MAIVGCAAALRAVGLAHGLPNRLLDPAERGFVLRAWRLVHDGSLAPHSLRRPPLLPYVLAPLQAWQHVPSYVTARSVVLVFGVAGVAAAWWLGSRAYGLVGGAVAAVATAVETTHVAASRTALPDVPMTTLATVSLALLVAGRVELGAAAAGIATAMKYPGAILIVPLLAATWGRWRRVASSTAIALAAFLAAAPFAATRPGAAAEGIARGLGWRSNGRYGFGDLVGRLWHGFGPALLIAAAALLVALLRRRPPDVVLAAFVLAYVLRLVPLHTPTDRELLPLVPALGALAGRLRSLAAVTLLLLVVPLTYAVRDDRDLLRSARPEVRIHSEPRYPLGVRAGLASAALAAVLACSGCASADSASPSHPSSQRCPKQWAAGWRSLAKQVHAGVYCPRWMPNPLDAEIGGQFDNGRIVKNDRSYVVSFLTHDQSGDVHVNFRGYPGRTRIPRCLADDTVAGKMRRHWIPCFSDPGGHFRARGIDATLYTVNQDWDQWHLLYAWRKNGSLYTVSEHVIKPLTYAQVQRNLDRLVRGLVYLSPS